MKKVLFVCNDTIGYKMAGPAIRCLELAKTMATEFSVELSARNLDAGFVPAVPVVSDMPDAVAAAADRADVVIVQGDALRRHPYLLETKAVLVADLYCPIPLEYHIASYRVTDEVRLQQGWYAAQVMQQQLFYADYFICASERQRDFWFGALTMAGRINALSVPDANNTPVDRLISCVPFGLPDTLPPKNGSPLRTKFGIPKDDFLMVWGGGVYEWFDPLTIVKAIARLDQEGLKAHLVFLGVKHPNPGINEHDRVGEAVALSRELGVLDRLVHFNFGWVDYDRRHEFLFDADVGVSAHLNNVETRYSFRTRMLDYLWCGLPIIATQGDEFGDMVDREKLGITVDYEDCDGWCGAIRQMIQDTGRATTCRENVARVREEYMWSRAAKPLIEACQTLSPSPDRNFSRANALKCRVGADNMIRPSYLLRLRDAYRRYGLAGTIKAVASRITARLGVAR